MSASTDMPTSAQIARLTEDLRTHRQDLRTHLDELGCDLAELQRKVAALERDVDGIPAALELARMDRKMKSWDDLLRFAGAIAIAVGVPFGISALIVAIVR